MNAETKERIDSLLAARRIALAAKDEFERLAKDAKDDSMRGIYSAQAVGRADRIKNLDEQISALGGTPEPKASKTIALPTV